MGKRCSSSFLSCPDTAAFSVFMRTREVLEIKISPMEAVRWLGKLKFTLSTPSLALMSQSLVASTDSWHFTSKVLRLQAKCRANWGITAICWVPPMQLNPTKRNWNIHIKGKMKSLKIEHKTDARQTMQARHNKDNLNKDKWNQEFKENGISKWEIGRVSEGHTNL